MEATTAVYFIAEDRLDGLHAAVAKLNKRGARLGLPAIVVTSVPDHLRYEVSQPQADCTGSRLCWVTAESFANNQTSTLPATKTGRVRAWLAVTVTGSTPTYDGWTFAATLEPIDADGTTINLVQTVPGKEVPASYRKDIGRCEHCNVARNRKQTFVLQHADGTYKVVGRQCLKDFLGYNGDPHALASAAELAAELHSVFSAGESDGDEDSFGSGAFRIKSWDLEFFLTWTVARINKAGWLGRGKARDMGDCSKSTADAVLYLLTPPWSGAPADVKREWEAAVAETQPDDNDATKASAAIDWAKGLLEAECDASNYLSNVNAVSRAGYVTSKLAGIAASTIAAYIRAQDDEIKRQQFAARPASVYVGTVGKRSNFRVTCQRVIATEGSYGTTGIHKMVDDKGNDLTWFASGSTSWLKEGRTYDVKATVKAHDAYNGRPQTIVSRLAVVAELELAPV